MADVYIFCEQVLKERVLMSQNLSESMKNVLKNNGKIKIKELGQVDYQENLDQFVYVAALILVRACEDAPLGFNKTALYWPYFEWFKQSGLEYSAVFDSVIINLIEKEIRSCLNVDELIQWLQLIRTLKDKYKVNSRPNLNLAFFVVANYVWLDMKFVMCIDDENETCKYLENIKIFQDFGIIEDNIVSVVVSRIFRTIDKCFDIFGTQLLLGNRVKFDVEKLVKIVFVLKKFSLNYDDSEIMKKILDFVSEKDKKNFSRKVLIDLSLLEYKKLIFSGTSENCEVFVWYANHPQVSDLIVKQYKAKFEIAKMFLVNSELDIIEKLSNMSGPENCFLKCYGRHLSENSYFLITEFEPYNLMLLLSELKRTNSQFPIQNLQILVKQLLNSFSIMEALNIAHHDIGPHNLLVTSKYELKIIGFKISENYKEVKIELNQGKLIQGPNGYEAPEIYQSVNQGVKNLSYNIEKAQVYSLGLTILQMIILENVSSLNRAENCNLLQYKISSVDIPWLRILLNNMLSYNPQDRKKFSELLSMIHSEDTNFT